MELRLTFTETMLLWGCVFVIILAQLARTVQSDEDARKSAERAEREGP